MPVLSGLKPESVFSYFEKLCAVPHGSGNTQIISDLCVSFARELGLKCRQEDCGNVVIWKDGSTGYENAAPIILQGHIDMVCAKTDDCTKDMTREGSGRLAGRKWSGQSNPRRTPPFVRRAARSPYAYRRRRTR